MSNLDAAKLKASIQSQSKTDMKDVAMLDVISQLEAAEARARAAEQSLEAEKQYRHAGWTEAHEQASRADELQAQLDALAKQEPVAFVNGGRRIMPFPGQELPIATRLFTLAAPAVPVKVPNRIMPKSGSHQSHVDYAEGWNDVIEEVMRMNNAGVSDE